MSPTWSVKSIKHDYFSAESLSKHPERFVLVGFIAADGCISVPKVGQSRLQFNLCAKDRCVLDYFNKEICNSTRNLSYVNCTKSFIFYIPSNRICDDLAPYGIVPRKTSKLRLPKLFDDQMRYFLRGYFYGDGCCYDAGRMSMYQFIGTAKFCAQAKKYLISNNIIDTCAIHSAKNPHYANIHIKGKHQVKKFADYLLFDDQMILLPRKHKRLPSTAFDGA